MSASFPTPDLSHLTRSDYEHVYEPAEDTFILLDALELDSESLQERRPLICLEIGSGSGCVSAFVSQILGRNQALYLCTDINPHAARCTVGTGRQNNVQLSALLTSLVDPLLHRLRGSVDLLLFNPPYVPTESDEADEAQAGGNIAGSWAGGADGMQVTNQVLQIVEPLLSQQGRFYLVAVKQNGIEEISLRMKHEYGLESRVVLNRRAGGEHLFVMCFMRGAA